MCAVSMITDHYRDKWPLPDYTIPPAVMPVTFAITWEQWNEYQSLKRKAEEYDKQTHQPDCVKPEVAQWEEQISKLVNKS